MLAATVVTTVKYGVIFPNASFKAGWNRLTRVPTPDMRERYAFVKEIAATIESDAAVSVTSAVGAHFSNRRKAYHWPNVSDADYLVLNVKNFKKDDERRLKKLCDKKQFRLVKEEHGIGFYARIDEEEAAQMRDAEKAAAPARRKPAARAKDAPKVDPALSLPATGADPATAAAATGASLTATPPTATSTPLTSAGTKSSTSKPPVSNKPPVTKKPGATASGAGVEPG